MSKIVLNLMGALSLLVAVPAFAGPISGWIEAQTVFHQQTDQQFTGQVKYTLAPRVDVYAFGTHIDRYGVLLGGVSFGVHRQLIIELGYGVDRIEDTHKRYALNGYLLLPHGLSTTLITEHGPNGRFIKSITQLRVNDRFGLGWRAETNKGWGPQVEMKLPLQMTMKVATLHGLGQSVNLLAIAR